MRIASRLDSSQVRRKHKNAFNSVLQLTISITSFCRNVSNCVASSSEAQTLKELKETVEELHKQYSQTQDTCSPVEEGTDNSKSTEDTDNQK